LLIEDELARDFEPFSDECLMYSDVDYEGLAISVTPRSGSEVSECKESYPEEFGEDMMRSYKCGSQIGLQFMAYMNIGFEGSETSISFADFGEVEKKNRDIMTE